MSKQFQFYATAGDLQGCFNDVETELTLKYADAWMSKTSEILVLDSLATWEALGKNHTGRTVGAGFFLIVDSRIELHRKSIQMDDGSTQFKYAPGQNPESIVIQPSGVYVDPENGNSELVLGMCGTAMANPGSLSLYKDFKRLFTKRLTRMKDGIFMGKEARQMVDDEALELSFG
ncbi:MAG: hypothetical protein AAF483_26625 [Planctomycetota bacterium]